MSITRGKKGDQFVLKITILFLRAISMIDHFFGLVCYLSVKVWYTDPIPINAAHLT